MRTRRGAAELFFALSLSCMGFGAVISCGSRTGLFVVEATPVESDAADAGTDVVVAVSPPPDANPPPVPDAPPPPPPDVAFPPPDTPPFDALPPIDVDPLPDVFVNDCPDAGSTLVYVVTEQNELFSFYPPTGAFSKIGILACPVENAGASPFSMAVDKKGTAFVVFSDGELFQVSTQTAACIGTPFTPGQQGIQTFGMGFVGDSTGSADTLYVAADNLNLGTSVDGTLATIDTTNTFLLSVIGDFNPESVTQAELTGTGDGRLFAFYATADNSSAVAQIDPATATLTANNNLFNLPQGGGWAFSFWGGDFYLFTAPSGAGEGSQVTQFDPTTLVQTTVAFLPTTIVGAGVSTCAPMQ